MVTRSISHYRVLKKLGEGGMGEVYLAEDSRLDRRVAVKLLGEEFNSNEDRLRRFVGEAKAASALNHPNILTVYDIGVTDGGAHFIATEYIEGETLRDYLQRSRAKILEVLEFMAQVASALSAAHQAGIIHRDIKPENIMLRPDGLVKVLDFGLAKSTEKPATRTDSEAATVAKKETDPGTIMGTVAYMSPEQARGKEVDARSDIFSLGVALYEMIAGRAPFAGESSTDVLAAILDKEPLPLLRFVDDLPQELQRIVTKCLRKDREERYQTMKDVLLDLRELRDELALEAKLERSMRLVSKIENQPMLIAEPEITREAGRQTGPAAAAQTTSSAEYLVSEIKQHKRGIAVVVLALLFAAFGTGYWFFFLRSSTANAPIDSIAVLPLTNAGGDKESEFLSDGIAETLINNFTKIPELKVTARSTAFRFRGREGEPQAVGRELGVDAVLTGKLLQRGDSLSIQVDLINASNGVQIWGDRYDGKSADIVNIQQRIATDVSRQLKLKLTGAQAEQVAKTYTQNSEAYQHYLRGRYHWNKRTADDLKKALEEFRAAADIDPNYALAYVGLGDCYVLLEEYAGTPASETVPAARAFVQKALQIDDSIGEAHATLGMINRYEWRWADAEKSFLRAIELNPNYPTARHWFSINLRDTGQYDRAFAEIKRAQELDPLSPAISANVGMIYMIKGDASAALAQFNRIIELNPNSWVGHHWLGIAYLRFGRGAEATAALEKSVELNRSHVTLSPLGYAYAVSGREKEARAILNELRELYAKKQANAFNIAAVYTGLGEREQAFEWLEKFFQERSGLLSLIRWYPQFEPLRDDPRFKDLLKRMNLPE